jgi:hypothetical protein
MALRSRVPSVARPQRNLAAPATATEQSKPDSCGRSHQTSETTAESTTGPPSDFRSPAQAAEEEASVLARHARIREHDITRVVATDEELLLSATPVQRQQRPLLLSMAGDGALTSTYRGAHLRGQSCADAAIRASQIQVANELWRIDYAALQQLIKPVKERSFAEQSVGVRSVQRPRDTPV